MHKQRQSQPASRPDVALGLPERLALYAYGVGCLLAYLLESPVPMAIAP